MNKKILLLLIMLISIFALSHASAMDDAEFIAEDNSTDTLSIDEHYEINEFAEDSQVNDYKLEIITEYRHIQEQIDNANEGDTINLTGNYTCDYIINVNKTVTIEGIGGGATISYNGTNPVQTPFFCINASNVILKNIKFSDATFAWGGALTWLGDNGSIIDCEFENNIARGNNAIGGAILLLGDNCNITNCTFYKNSADLYAGAILCNGTGGVISNCVFRENEASGEKGHGGAIVIWGNEYKIINCNFTQNHCSDYGGAISILKENNTVMYSRFYGNYITNSLDENQTQGGGAIFNDFSSTIIDNCTFIDNHADQANGGAISLFSEDTVKNSYFKGNKAFFGNDLAFLCFNVINNYFVLDYDETISDAVQVGLFEYNLTKLNNVFNKSKINSTITFSAEMVFEYTRSGSIIVKVEGGMIEEKNIRVLNHPEAKITFKDELLTVSNLAVGTYTLSVTTTPDENHNAVEGNLSIKVNKATAVIKASKITVALKKGTAWTITLVDAKTGKGIANMKITLKVYTGKKFKTVTVYTNSKGVATYKTSSLAKGTHKVVVSASHAGYNFNTLSSSIKVVKPKKLTFKASKHSFKDTSTVMFRVFDKTTKKPLNGVKFYLKIYNGKKVVKTIKLKTKTYSKKKGIVGYSTNDLTVGKHKVVLEPVDVKYSGTKSSSLKITKKQKKYPKYSSKLSG